VLLGTILTRNEPSYARVYVRTHACTSTFKRLAEPGESMM
jgi:hypothetical protein